MWKQILRFIKNNVLRKFMITSRQYLKSYRHNQTFDQQNKTYCFGIDIRLLFLVSIARTAGMNMNVKRQEIRAYERGGRGGTMTPGPMGFRGLIMEPVGFRGPGRGPIEMTQRNQYVEGRRSSSFFFEITSKSGQN